MTVLLLVAIFLIDRYDNAPGAVFGDGQYEVGSESDSMYDSVYPGRYKASHPPPTCRYGVYASRDQFNPNSPNNLHTIGSSDNITIALRSGSFFYTNGCGTWQSIELSP